MHLAVKLNIAKNAIDLIISQVTISCSSVNFPNNGDLLLMALVLAL